MRSNHRGMETDGDAALHMGFSGPGSWIWATVSDSLFPRGPRPSIFSRNGADAERGSVSGLCGGFRTHGQLPRWLDSVTGLE